MQDFDSYSQGRRDAAAGKTGGPRQGGAQKQDADAFAETARRMAGAFGGKGEEEILRAIYKEAERGRRAGTLSDADIDNFAAAVAPMLDAAKRKKLEQIVARLKKIR